MGEDKRKPSSKRQRSSRIHIDKSSSDSELAPRGHRKRKARKSKVKERWPFPEGLTVDGLARYRRRRVQAQRQDNLAGYPDVTSEDFDKHSISEYRRAFRASSEDIHKQENVWLDRSKGSGHVLSRIPSEETSENVHPSNDHEDIKEYASSSGRQKQDPETIDDRATMETESKSCRSIGRPPLVRRGTSLKRGGAFYTDTETYSAYAPYEGQHRAELARRPTSLKMEGDFETMTEKCEKFIQWLNVTRAEMARVPTHLKLEGELETTTENHEKYIPFVGVRRPGLLRQAAHLRLDGETTFVPEYADVFKEHPIKGRELPIKPETHLKLEGDFRRVTEISENFVDPRAREASSWTGGSTKEAEVEDEGRTRQQPAGDDGESEDEHMKLLVSKLEDLQHAPPSLGIPEYRDAYKDFPRERPKLVKPEDEIGRADGTKLPSTPAHSRFSRRIDRDPEYKSKYLDYPGERRTGPVHRKPPIPQRTIHHPNDDSAKRRSGGFVRHDGHREYDRFDYDEPAVSEARSQYVPYARRIPLDETAKTPATQLRFELGNLDLRAECRKDTGAYCAGGIDCRESNESRSSASRRKENYWIRNDNAEQFGCINAAQDQDAFQLVSTRVHEESVVEKPPMAGGRGSRVSQFEIERPSQLDVVARPTSKTRASSPSYRLHVCNVDDEPRGFARRRSPPRFSEKVLYSASDASILDDDNRSYSPSFGRESGRQPNARSFVLLDNTIGHGSSSCKREEGRRRIDKHSNVDDRSTAVPPRGRPTKTPTNWMPPWYDSTNTI